MRIGNRCLMLSIGFLCLITALSLPSAVTSQAEGNARFTQVTHSKRIRIQAPDAWTFEIYNSNCSEYDNGTARFFFEFYVDDNLWFNEYNSTNYKTWSCRKGETVSHDYQIEGWSDSQPVTRGIEIRLYCFSNGVARLEDTTSFKIDVTMHVQLQHIFAISYLAVYFMAAFALLAYDYVAGLEE